jgi:hypothetical protein
MYFGINAAAAFCHQDAVDCRAIVFLRPEPKGGGLLKG